MIKFGFIGVGHMGSTLARAVVRAVGAENVAVCGGSSQKAERFAAETGCALLDDLGVAERCRYIFLGVKPQDMAKLLADIAPALRRREDFALVTMAAGITIERMEAMLGFPAPVLRIMPNTPAAVGAGCTLYAAGPRLGKGELGEILTALGPAGELVELPEKLMDAGSAVSGCGPAFVYKFMLALAKAGEGLGLEGETALRLAELTVLGAARLALESGVDPEELCRQVCSPGGSTIEGVRSLEAGDFDAQVQMCVDASYRRTAQLGAAKPASQ